MLRLTYCTPGSGSDNKNMNNAWDRTEHKHVSRDTSTLDSTLTFSVLKSVHSCNSHCVYSGRASSDIHLRSIWAVSACEWPMAIGGSAETLFVSVS